MITLESRISYGEQVLSQLVDGEAVLVHLDGGRYFGLNEVGARMWTLIGELGRAGAIAERIVAEFEVTPDVAARDLLALLEQLAAKGLVVVDGPPR